MFHRGSVLFLMLFAIDINSITSVLPPGLLSTLYVDDFLIFIGEESMASVERYSLQWALSLFSLYYL